MTVRCHARRSRASTTYRFTALGPLFEPARRTGTTGRGLKGEYDKRLPA